MKKVVKKVVAKAPVKKTVAKKPMMKSGGPKRSLRKYQGDEGGSEVAPAPSSSTTPTRTFADAYKANIDAGLRPGQAKRIAMVESGVKAPKTRVDPNAIINAVGNTAGAVGSAVNAFRPQSSGPMGPMKKGGVKKMQDGGPTTIDLMRRNRLTKKADRLEKKGDLNMDSGNTDKAWKKYNKADDVRAKRSAIREKAGYKKGGAIKATAKKTMVKSKKK